MNNRKIYRHASPRRARAARIKGARARENMRARPGSRAHTHGAAGENTQARADEPMLKNARADGHGRTEIFK